MTSTSEKAAIRVTVGQQIAAMSHGARAGEAAAVCKSLEEEAIGIDSRGVLAFLPMAGEIDITAFLASLLARGVPLAVPTVNWEAKTMEAAWLTSLDEDGVKTDTRGVTEPATIVAAELEAIDLIIVPGIAFDTTCQRLGRGGGFYDRFLLTTDQVTVGVCFQCQMVEAVPSEPHDIPVAAVVTAGGRHPRR